VQESWGKQIHDVTVTRFSPNLVSPSSAPGCFSAHITALRPPRDSADTDHCGSLHAFQTLPDRAFPAPTISMRGAAFRYHRPSRTKPRSRVNSAKTIGTGSMATTTASPSVREQFTQEGREQSSLPSEHPTQPPLADLARLDIRLSRAVFKPPSSASACDRFVRHV